MYATSKALIHQTYTTYSIDGPVIVQLLKPIGADNLEDDAQQVFLRYVTSQRSSRIEVIWDISVAALIFLLQRGELM